MSTLNLRIALSAALSAAFLLGAASPSRAQAQPIVTGEGEVVSPVVGQVGVELALVQLPNGSLEGGGTATFDVTGGWATFELTSYVFVDDMLCMAGPVTAAFDAPPAYYVGATAVFCIDDGGNGAGQDTMAGTAGPPNLTIQQIIGFIGPPPPQVFQPVVSGNFTIH